MNASYQSELKSVFFLVRATPSWLSESPVQRQRFVDETLRPILARHAEVRVRYFDAEAFCAATSDVVLWEFRDERQYRALVEELRETRFWGDYFNVHTIIPAVENDFARHYTTRTLDGRSV